MNFRPRHKAESVIDLIGKTPMVQLKKIASDSPCPIIAKSKLLILVEVGKAILALIDAAESEDF